MQLKTPTKKIGSLLFITILILQLINLQIVSAIDTTQFDKGVDTIDNTADAIENAKETYLTQEWTKLVQKSKYFSWIYKFNPVFKFLFGQEFTVSWAFLSVVLLWMYICTLYTLLLRITLKDTFLALGISIVFTSLTAQFLMPKVVQLLATIIKTIWHWIGFVILIIIIMYLTQILSKIIAKKTEKKREEKRIKKLEEEAAKSRAMRKGLEEIKRGSEEMEKGFKGE